MTRSKPSVQRMFYNDDGDTCCGNYRGSFRRQMVTDAVDVLLGTPVTTLVFCVAYGDLTNYPTQVASMISWRKTPWHESGVYRRYYEFYEHMRQQGWDIPEMLVQRAADKGLEFVPSMRMNDAHFVDKVDPREHPLTSRFWMENQDLIIRPGARWEKSADHLEFLLDFKHEKVRRFRLEHAFEIIDRYAADGFELDFTRHYCYFEAGKQQPDLITDMVQQVRSRLDQRGDKSGKRLPLIVRVAASIETNQQLGLDVASWIHQGLVDYVVPHDPSRYMAVDMPIDEWVDLAKDTDVEIHASPDSAAHWGNGQATLEMYRAAASNYYAMGADGFYVFNLFCQGFPLENDQYRILRDVSSTDALSRCDKHFMAQPAPNQWRKDADTLPVSMQRNGPAARVGVWVGDDLAEARANSTLNRVVLRIRLDRIEPQELLNITLNDVALPIENSRVEYPDRRANIANNASVASWTWQYDVLGGDRGVWFEFDLARTLPVRGDNIVTVALQSSDPAGTKDAARLINVDLHVSYDYCGHDLHVTGNNRD